MRNKKKKETMTFVLHSGQEVVKKSEKKKRKFTKRSLKYILVKY